MLLLMSADCFSFFSSKNSFWNSIRVSNSLDPDQYQHFVGPGLSPNSLQRLSADDKSRCHIYFEIQFQMPYIKSLFLILIVKLLLNTFAAKRDCSRIYRSLPNATTVEI